MIAIVRKTDLVAVTMEELECTNDPLFDEIVEVFKFV